jgi:glyoxylase-like metal-dependent hydrolase (beta-lactamase superfamily II)
MHRVNEFRRTLRGHSKLYTYCSSRNRQCEAASKGLKSGPIRDDQSSSPLPVTSEVAGSSPLVPAIPSSSIATDFCAILREMRLSARCFAVTGLAYVPPWSVNSGFVAGEQITLVVDTGANALAAATIHGYASAARPDNRLIVINTEKHFDHIGGNGFFREQGIDVHGHIGIQRTEDEFRAEIAEFNEQISSPARRAGREAEVFYSGTKLVNPNLPISQDTMLSLGSCEVEIILTPGHTPTNLSVYVPSDGVLFCGDCLVNGYMPNLDCGTSSDWQNWLRSLDRIAGLAPKIVVPGHGPVARDGEVTRLIKAVRKTIERSLESGLSPTSQSSTTGAD